VAKITINRPKVYNAFRPETNIQMLEAIDGIFKILPGYKNNIISAKFIETRHELSTKHLARMHGFEYSKARSEIGLKWRLYSFFKKSSKPRILEINTNSDLSSDLLKKYFINLK